MSIYDDADEAFERGELGRVREILTPAAVAGDAEAQATLGMFLTLTRHMRPFREGVDWLRSAANAGHAVAAYNVAAVLLSGGPGVTPDCEAAMHYMRRARECGFEATVSSEVSHDNSQAWVVSSDSSPLPLMSR
jgi:TPR repeat protein